MYIDGFSSPGYYNNFSEGSPIAALKAASEAVTNLGSEMAAKTFHCGFIEKSTPRFEEMKKSIRTFVGMPKIGITHYNGDFVTGIQAIKTEVPGPFRGEGPLFVFADPFGGTGNPEVCCGHHVPQPIIQPSLDFLESVLETASEA